MNTVSRAATSLICMTGLVAAQPRPAGTAESKPPAEIADKAKATAGIWRCRGRGMDRTSQMKDMIGTLRIRADLDGWWLHRSFESRIGREPFHFEAFETFDPTSRTWKTVIVTTGGRWSAGQSPGMKDRKIDWELTMHSAMGEAMFRDHADLSDPRAGAKLSGELSTDQGKTWTKVYEMACKK